MGRKYNVVKTSWKLWILFFVFIGFMVILERFFDVNIPENFIFVVIAMIVGIYLVGLYMARKNQQGGA